MDYQSGPLNTDEEVRRMRDRQRWKQRDEEEAKRDPTRLAGFRDGGRES